MSGKKTYLARLRCTNCGQLILLEIPRGTYLKEYLKGLEGLKTTCVYCGCNPRKI